MRVPPVRSADQRGGRRPDDADRNHDVSDPFRDPRWATSAPHADAHANADAVADADADPDADPDAGGDANANAARPVSNAGPPGGSVRSRTVSARPLTRRRLLGECRRRAPAGFNPNKLEVEPIGRQTSSWATSLSAAIPGTGLGTLQDCGTFSSEDGSP